MKLAIILNRKRFSAKLTKLFTGCYAYHCAWVDEQQGKMWDMHLIRRRRTWPHYGPDTEVELFDIPQVTSEYLERQLESDRNQYSIKDYLLFALRPIYHLFGKNTRNAKGLICSEMINFDMRVCGVSTPWDVMDAPPSPCDLFKWLVNQK